MSHEELIASHLASKGVTRCAPAHALGNEMKGASRRHVSKVRRSWSETNGVALKLGQVRS
jgi:hypothetical protein